MNKNNKKLSNQLDLPSPVLQGSEVTKQCAQGNECKFIALIEMLDSTCLHLAITNPNLIVNKD